MMPELFATVVTLILMAAAALVNALIRCLKVAFVLTGRTLRLIAPKEDVAAIAVEFQFQHNNNNNNNTKRVCVMSPDVKRVAKPLPADPDHWCLVCDIDGVSSLGLPDVSLRFKEVHGVENRVQATVSIQKFGSTKLHRVVYKGFVSTFDNNGRACQGEEANGVIYLPQDADAVLTPKPCRSQQSGSKYYGLKADFGGNTDSLSYVQILIPVGTVVKMSDALAFEDQLFRALSGGLPHQVPHQGENN